MIGRACVPVQPEPGLYVDAHDTPLFRLQGPTSFHYTPDMNHFFVLEKKGFLYRMETLVGNKAQATLVLDLRYVCLGTQETRIVVYACM